MVIAEQEAIYKLSVLSGIINKKPYINCTFYSCPILHQLNLPVRGLVPFKLHHLNLPFRALISKTFSMSLSLYDASKVTFFFVKVLFIFLNLLSNEAKLMHASTLLLGD
jgi:hypothetical protein